MPLSRSLLSTVRSIVAAGWEGYCPREDRERIEPGLVEAGLAKAGSVRVRASGMNCDGTIEPGSDVEFETPDGAKVYAVVSDMLWNGCEVSESPLYLSMYS